MAHTPNIKPIEIVDQIEIRIMGSKTGPQRTLAAAASAESAVSGRSPFHIEMAHPTRVECVTFAFEEQRNPLQLLIDRRGLPRNESLSSGTTPVRGEQDIEIGINILCKAA